MKNLQDLQISTNSADSLCTTNQRNWRKVALLSYLKKKNSKEELTPWTKVVIGGEYLVWEGKENFRGFCVIDLV